MKYSPHQMATDLQTIQIGLPDFPKMALKIGYSIERGQQNRKWPTG